MKLPGSRYFQWRDETGKEHFTPYYTEAQMREMYEQGLEDAAKECFIAEDSDDEYVSTRHTIAKAIRKLKEQAND